MLISVITPTHNPNADYLAAAYDSLLAQQMPARWAWEWLVQLDGEGELPLPPAAFEDPRVKPDTGRHGGPGTARNLALARSRGQLVRNLDSDDVLTPHALADAIDVLMSEPDIGWTTCRALDLMPNGELVEFPDDAPAGRLQIGYVYDYWTTHDYLLNVHPTTITIRRQLLLAIGGWMALPTSEDTGMMLAASELADGWFIPDFGLHYRQHADQITKADHHVNEKAARRSLVDERVRAIRAMRNPAPGGLYHVGGLEVAQTPRFGDERQLG